MSLPPEAYWRVMVMRGGAMRSNRTAPSAVGYRLCLADGRKPIALSVLLQILPQVADVQERQASLGRHEDDEVLFDSAR